MKTEKMPALFIGHGNPMNAIEKNEFTETLSKIGSQLPLPKAIICISAHWLTEGTWVTHMKNPKTIHDFYGFPKELFDVQYSAPGSPELADSLVTKVTDYKIQTDEQSWGLDHGTWSVLKHIYPKANVPVIQLSIDIQKPASYHLNLAKELNQFRDQGVLIIGSGNIVHNLRRMDWETTAQPHDWAIEFDEWTKTKMLSRDFKSLSEDYILMPSGRLSVPTPDHYYPLMYVLGATNHRDQIKFEFEGIHNAAISMRCVSFT